VYIIKIVLFTNKIILKNVNKKVTWIQKNQIMRHLFSFSIFPDGPRYQNVIYYNYLIIILDPRNNFTEIAYVQELSANLSSST
jgi:hypothetical protein